MEYLTEKLNPYIREAVNSIVLVGGHMKRRVIYDYELICVERGRFTYHYNGTDYDCKTGDIIFIRPGISHAFSNVTEELSQPHIHFDMFWTPGSASLPINFRDMDALSPEEKKLIQPDVFSSFPYEPFITIRNRDAFFRLFYGILDGWGRMSPLKAKGDLLQIIDMMIRDNFYSIPPAVRHEIDICEQIRDFIESGQGDNMSLDEIEKRFWYSKYHLEKEFKKKYNMGIIAYKNECVMKKAAGMLKNSSVTAVASELGFSSIYAFSRAFRNKYGVSPTDYLQKEKQKKDLSLSPRNSSPQTVSDHTEDA